MISLLLNINNKPKKPNTMTKLQSILDLANRMINAGMDEKAVGEVLISELQNEIDNLKVEAFDLLPVVHVNFIEEK